MIDELLLRPRNEYTDLDWMRMAQECALKSTDQSTKIGCVIVNNETRQLVTGSNVMPQGFTRHQQFHDRPAKYTLTVHAEMSAILDSARWGKRLNGSTLYSSMFPCSKCAPHIIAAGITTVVSYPIRDERNLALTNSFTREKWVTEAELSRDILTLAGVNIRYIT